MHGSGVCLMPQSSLCEPNIPTTKASMLPYSFTDNQEEGERLPTTGIDSEVFLDNQ